MTAPTSGTPFAIPAAPPLCERCGSFITEPRPAGAGARCASCALGAPGLKPSTGAPLYPTGYIVVMGLVFNCAVAGILAAINWTRLGDRRRARLCGLTATVGGIAVVALMLTLNMADPSPSGVLALLAVNLVGTGSAAYQLGPRYADHRRLGGGRANLLTPVVALMLMLVVLAIALGGLFPNAGGPSPAAGAGAGA